MFSVITNQVILRLIWIFIDILILCVLIICIVLFYFLFHNLDFDFNNIDNIIQTFESTPLFDISFEEECPSNKKVVVLDKWPGTVEGYYCEIKQAPELGSNEYEIYRVSNKPKIKDCHHIQKTKPIQIISFHGMKICAKKVTKKFSYYSLLKKSVKEDEECPKGMKQCGYLDTLNNKMCVEESDNCPLNYIKLSKYSTPPVDCVSCKSFYFPNRGYIYYSNQNINNHIITNFKFTDHDENVCLDQSEYNANKGRYELDHYKYYGCKNTFNGYKYDPRYKRLDMLDKTMIYEENNIMKVIEKLPMYPSSDLLSCCVSLYMRSYLGFDLQCLSKINFTPSQLINYKHNAHTFRNLNIAIPVFISINVVLEVFIIIKKWKNNYKDPTYFLTWFVITDGGVSFILSITSFVYILAIKHIGIECGDKYTRSIPIYSNNDVNRDEMYIIIVFSLNVLLIAFCFIDDAIGLIFKASGNIQLPTIVKKVVKCKQEKDTERVLQTLPSNELQVITFHCNPKEKGKTLN